MKIKTKTKLKKGILVEVIAGKEKGKRGKLLGISLKSGRAVVEGVNLSKRHAKPSQKNPQGGILSKEASIHLSNIMAVDPKTNRPSRIGSKKVAGKDKSKPNYVRVFKSSGEPLEIKGEQKNVEKM